MAISFYVLCMAHQATAVFTLSDVTDILCFEVTIYDSKTQESVRPVRNTRFRLPGIKLIRNETALWDNRKIQSHCVISIMPIEILTICLGIKYVPKLYQLIRDIRYTNASVVNSN